MMDSSAGRRTWSRRTSSWGARVVHRQRDHTRPSARLLGFLLLATPSLGPSGCLLDPLKIGPGDELSDEADEATDLLDESDESSSSSSSSSDSDSADGSTSSSDASSSEGDPSDTSTDSSSDSTGDTGEPTCGPQGSLPEASCETLLGHYWDGESCLPLYGCDCGPDCPPLFDSAVDCWSAYLPCGPSPCAGLDEATCLADSLCAPHYGRPLLLDIDTVCAAPQVYAGCGLAIPCANGSYYACAVQDPDAVHLFAQLCLPEWDWFECDPPTLDPILDCP